MNDKDKEMHRIIDAVIECCTTTLDVERYSVSKEDVLGKCKRDNANITEGTTLRTFMAEHSDIDLSQYI